MKKRRILGLIAATIVSLSILAGCGNKSEEVKTQNDIKKVSTLKGEASIPANPKRIVDISGVSEELLILGHTPVATANSDAYKTNEFPSYTKDKMGNAKIVGYYMMDTMDIESILEADPDLIIMSQRQEKIYDQLKDVAPVVMMKDYVNDWRARMTDVAKLFGEESDAQKWFNEYDKRAQDIGKEIIQKNGKKSYLTVLASGDQFFIFKDSGIGSIIYDDMKLAKPSNIPNQDGISLPVVTMEGLSEIDADHIVVIATEADKKNLENSSVWKSMRAVKEGNVTILDSTPYFGQGYLPMGKELLLDLVKEEVIK